VGTLGLDALFVLGDSAELVAESACAAGLDPGCVHVGEDHAALARALRAELAKDDRVLFKGSRSAGMEKIIHALEGSD
jgi:UDP-N-acetylmuramyl pentapeptide synthase